MSDVNELYDTVMGFLRKHRRFGELNRRCPPKCVESYIRKIVERFHKYSHMGWDIASLDASIVAEAIVSMLEGEDPLRYLEERNLIPRDYERESLEYADAIFEAQMRELSAELEKYGRTIVSIKELERLRRLAEKYAEAYEYKRRYEEALKRMKRYDEKLRSLEARLDELLNRLRVIEDGLRTGRSVLLTLDRAGVIKLPEDFRRFLESTGVAEAFEQPPPPPPELVARERGVVGAEKPPAVPVPEELRVVEEKPPVAVVKPPFEDFIGSVKTKMLRLLPPQAVELVLKERGDELKRIYYDTPAELLDFTVDVRLEKMVDEFIENRLILLPVSIIRKYAIVTTSNIVTYRHRGGVSYSVYPPPVIYDKLVDNCSKRELTECREDFAHLLTPEYVSSMKDYVVYTYVYHGCSKVEVDELSKSGWFCREDDPFVPKYCFVTKDFVIVGCDVPVVTWQSYARKAHTLAERRVESIKLLDPFPRATVERHVEKFKQMWGTFEAK